LRREKTPLADDSGRLSSFMAPTSLLGPRTEKQVP